MDTLVFNVPYAYRIRFENPKYEAPRRRHHNNKMRVSCRRPFLFSMFFLLYAGGFIGIRAISLFIGFKVAAIGPANRG